MNAKLIVSAIALMALFPAGQGLAQDEGPAIMQGKGCSVYANGERDRDASHWTANEVLRQEQYQTTYIGVKATLGQWNDRISAVQCYSAPGARCYIDVYSDENRTGRSLNIPDTDGFVRFAGTEWDNGISSFAVVCVRLN